MQPWIESNEPPNQGEQMKPRRKLPPIAWGGAILVGISLVVFLIFTRMTA